MENRGESCCVDMGGGSGYLHQDPAPYYPRQKLGAGPQPKPLQEGTQSPLLCSPLAVGCPARLLRALPWPCSFLWPFSDWV